MDMNDRTLTLLYGGSILLMVLLLVTAFITDKMYFTLLSMIPGCIVVFIDFVSKDTNNNEL